MFRTTVLALVLAAPAAPLAAQEADATDRRSSFGVYEGWSTERFDGWTTTSTYVEMRDGVRLAVDVTRPTSGGAVAEEPLPCVWTHSRYHRNVTALAGGTRTISMVDAMPQLQRLARHGYVVASVGTRGGGASFGRYEGLFSEAETDDAVEICAWLAAQPWCDGNLGMYGGSYLGITQYMTASRKPPGLKAIVPDVAALDLYDVLYPGGVFRDDLIEHWDALTEQLDTELLAEPVQGDEDAALRDAAAAVHADNWAVLEGYRAARYRDSAVPGLDFDRHGPSGVLDAVVEARIPAYHFNGWLDVFALDTLLWHANYAAPQRVLMGSWGHATLTPERVRLQAIEQHRWFDRWLKGIPNGVEEGPSIHYALMVEPGESRWESADAWPPPGVASETWWLAPGEGESGAVPLGELVRARPWAAERHAYAIDPTTTTGTTTRWDHAVGNPVLAYGGLAENDAKALTYTTAPLAEDLVVIGSPVVTLVVTASAGDADLVVLLEEVADDGDVRYVTEGVLRASHRALAEAPWDNLGLPFQRSFAEDVDPLDPGEVAALTFDLHPTATVFDAGHRLRLAVTCADADNLEPPRVELPASIEVLLGGASASSVELPVRR